MDFDFNAVLDALLVFFIGLVSMGAFAYAAYWLSGKAVDALEKRWPVASEPIGILIAAVVMTGIPLTVWAMLKY